MHVIRLPRAVAALAIALPTLATAPVAAQSAQQPTLHALFESAWQRAPLARTLAARRDEAAAEQELAGSWQAAAPVLGLSQRSDRWTDQRDRRESEVSLSSSFWTPGQMKRRSRLAHAISDDVDLQLALARLEIAGLVRAQLWETAAAHDVVLEKERYLQLLEELTQDVERRVGAGDLPRSDLLLARQEVLAAHSGLIKVRGAAHAANLRFATLTGMPPVHGVQPEPTPPASDAAPIRKQAALSAERRARATLAAASAQASAAPTVALSMRRERDGITAPNNRSVGIALQIPLVGKQRNRPLEAAAATQLATASAELQLVEVQAEGDLALARSRLLDAVEALHLAEQRANTALEHTRLVEKAFSLGERALAELLRAKLQLHEAQMALRQQRITLGQSHADLNQALGILP